MKFSFDIIKKTKSNKDHIFGEKPSADLEILIQECRENLPKFNESLIRKAFEVCLQAHKNKLRKSGEPFYTHPLAVARIVISEIPLDDLSVAAALLHNVVDEGDFFSIQDIRNEFGPVVAQIVDGISRIKYVESQHINSAAQMESYRKLLLALFKDVRIILIKLADRLHNMRTLDHLPAESQQRASGETLEIYAPFANRFGLSNIKWELEDLAFKYINREAYDQIRESLQLTREQREEYVDSFIAPIVDILNGDELLKKLKIKYEISGRPKHIYSIFNKTIIREKPIEELYDLFAVRVILDTDDRFICFYVYGLIASLYPPVPETFKDYISSPKKNGYQSLHTALIGKDQKAVEVQIRTKKMHEVSEKGVAAHFKYKSGKIDRQSVLEDQHLQDWMDVVREIFENSGNENTPALLEAVRTRLFKDEIYVFTPANEFKTLPKDATALDFAFDVHSEVGYRCIGAKVNGKVASISHKLANGDRVEILTSKNQKPSKEWLNYVVSSKATQALLKYLKDEEKIHETEGKEIWTKKIKEHGFNLSDQDFESLLKSLNFETPSDFFIALGSKNFNLTKAYEFIRYKIKDGFKVSIENKTNMFKDNEKIGVKPLKKYNPQTGADMVLGNCCNPMPGDMIFAHYTHLSGLTIHRADCHVIEKKFKTSSEEVYDIDWNQVDITDFVAKIHIIGEDRDFMLQDITKVMLENGHTNIYGVNFSTKDSMFDGEVSVKIENTTQLTLLFDEIAKIDGVKTVERAKNNSSEFVKA